MGGGFKRRPYSWATRFAVSSAAHYIKHPCSNPEGIVHVRRNPDTGARCNTRCIGAPHSSAARAAVGGKPVQATAAATNVLSLSAQPV